MASSQPDRPARSSTSSPIPLIRVDKPGGGTRQIAVLGPGDRRTYATAVARVVPTIGSALAACVMADRATVLGSEVVLDDWRRSRRIFRSMLRAQLASHPGAAVFVGDVHSCFTSIRHPVIDRALRRIGCRPTDAEGVVSVVRGFAERGIIGLPVGPVPSAPLANAVLAHADRAISAEGVAHMRWVDDVVAVCRDRPAAIRARDAFHRALAEDGLQANLSKTMILDDPIEAARRLLGSAGSSPAAHQRAMLRAP
jgi:hypothetical protein